MDEYTANTPDATEIQELSEDPEADTAGRRGAGIWLVLLVLVVVFGYLTANRRETLGKLAEQIANIIGDFRGYDPEF